VPEELLALRDVAVSFGAGSGVVHAIRQASAHFESGQTILIMGPSGSGKTTLLSVLGLLLKPNQGEIQLKGRSLARVSQAESARIRRDSIGFVFQAFRLFHSLSALENVMIALSVAGRPHPTRGLALALLDSLGIAHKAEMMPHDLSGGEKQRVALARALANDPPIILADEPTASLDTAAGKQVAGILKSLSQREGRLVIAVTHDHRLTPYADRLLTMKDGFLEEERAAR
jgi:putative ABC transport system ATP-binding protein